MSGLDYYICECGNRAEQVCEVCGETRCDDCWPCCWVLSTEPVEGDET